MLERFQLLKNIGQFDHAAAGAQFPSLTRLSLVYGENGRGKTTLAAILKSASTGDTAGVMERQRLASPNQPEVVLTVGGANRTFQNGAWNVVSPEVVVFDDAFVAANVCSGIAVEAGHRQNLHELILGAQGVSLNATLRRHVARIEDHNKTIRQLENAIPAATRGTLTINNFCALPNEDDIDAKITNAERALAAAQKPQAIQAHAPVIAPNLPAIDVGQINALLGQTLKNVQADAMARVRRHLACLGKEGEEWIGKGMGYIPAVQQSDGTQLCPFCEQDLAASPILQHYQAYFSEAYDALKTNITDSSKSFSDAHHRDIQLAFERAVRELSENRTFWGAYIEMPEFTLDTAAMVRSWNAARDLVLWALRAKFSAPLDVIQLSDEALAAVADYDRQRRAMNEAVAPIIAKSADIALVKEQAAGANVGTAEADLARLHLIKVRHSEPVNGLCQAYLDEKAAKLVTEGLRDKARDALDNYRQNIFPIYQQAINDYLQRFGAGFRVDAVNSVNNRGGSSCIYNVVINQVAVPVTANEGASFRNTLSAGDRNTLALAFFFASLEQNAQLANVIVVIDDPMTSLDEHRSVATVQQIRLLLARVRQVIVLSHFKPYLCEVWKGANANERSAFLVRRDGQGSSIAEWDVRQDCITEHDKNHAVVAEFIRTGDPALERQAATALRPMLEAYLRVAYPEDFPPSTLIGPFINKCTPRAGTVTEILDQTNIAELRRLKDYGNNFHHDTNPAWQTQRINSQELTNFCQRVIRFTRR
ncbi:MAG: AAA family ATPase [Gluconobacter japonicus]|uniref:AAA family ATPase n=1 Tax=Gluconobacter japonicus TaxID=376620 RepID=UPI0039EA7B6E